MDSTRPQRARKLRIAAFVTIELEHGRGILRGIAHHFRNRPEVTVLRYGQTQGYELEALQGMRLDGIIAKVGTARDVGVFGQLGLPVINISGQMNPRDVPQVNSDDRRVGAIALDHFFRRGYRNVAYCGNARHAASRLRLAGFEAAAKAAGVAGEVPALFIPKGDQNTPYADSVRVALDSWLRSLPRPVGVFAFTDRVALELAEACGREGLRIPEEVALLGVGDDLTRIDFAPVALSSIRLNTERIGTLAAEALDRWIATGMRPGDVMVPPKKIITRRSSDHYAVADDGVSQALDYLRENLANPIYVNEVAVAAGVSRRALELRFRRALGTSVNSEALRMKMECAAELLEDPGTQVTEVAFKLGFGSLKDFSRAFSRYYSHSPREHRARSIEGKGGALTAQR